MPIWGMSVNKAVIRWTRMLMVLERRAVDQSDISDAIQLFENSKTARAGGRASDVVRGLWNLYNRNEIGFRVQRQKQTRGSYLAGRPGYDLQVSPQYIDGLPAKERLGALSLEVVHEAVHDLNEMWTSAPNNEDNRYLLDEMAARKLQVSYYRELTGPGVFNEANDPPRPGKQWGIIRVTPDRFPAFKEQSDFIRKDQLVDYVLSIQTYTADVYIWPKWIIDNLELWGGLKNRWPKTKGLYISVLAGRPDPYYSEAILKIMESVDQQKDWTEMLDKATDKTLDKTGNPNSPRAVTLRTIQIALDALGDRSSARIANLERRWRVRLTEQPPGL